ncbi:hypothetical protein GTA28_23110 [Rhodococcus hoagii]|nr:hypothetical protein [Prescottella equi]
MDHIGSICQAISAAGIDTTVWTGRDIAAALDADSRRRGWMWPAAIENPAALLAWRLRRMSWTGLSPPRSLPVLQNCVPPAEVTRQQPEPRLRRGERPRRPASGGWRKFRGSSLLVRRGPSQRVVAQSAPTVAAAGH